VAHGLVLFVLVQARPDGPKMTEPEPMAVALVDLPPPPEPPPPAPTPPVPTPEPEPAPVVAPKKPLPVKPRPRPHIARRAPASPDVAPVPAGEGPAADGVADAAEVSDAELAGAKTAGSGAGAGAGCNMTRRLQAALRKDRLAQAAVAAAHRGKAIRVWDGDWVRHPGQEGGGLAAIREAIMWEVAFAPEACRTERVHGLVLISLNDGPASRRIVVGSGEWRWSDLLFSRSGPLGGASLRR
jgi:hypothetical protein